MDRNLGAVCRLVSEEEKGLGPWSPPRFQQISLEVAAVAETQRVKSSPKQGTTEHRFEMLRNLLIKIMSEPVTVEGKQTRNT